MPGTRAKIDLHVDGDPDVTTFAETLDEVNRAYLLTAWISSDVISWSSQRDASAITRLFGLQFDGEVVRPRITFPFIEDFGFIRYDPPVVLMQTSLVNPADNLKVESFNLTGSWKISLSGLAKPLELLWKIFDPEERRHRGKMHRLDELTAELEVRRLVRQDIQESVQMNEYLRQLKVHSQDELEALTELTAEREVELMKSLGEKKVTTTRLELTKAPESEEPTA